MPSDLDLTVGDEAERSSPGKDLDGEVWQIWRSTTACSSGLRFPKRCRWCSSWTDRGDGETTASGVSRKRRTSRRSRWRGLRARSALVILEFLAGVAPAVGEIWPRTYSLMWSAHDYKNMSGGSVRKPEAVWSKQEGSGWPYLTVIVDGGLRLPRDPELCCGQPGGSRVRKREAK
jgi:hypothetical protein